MRRPILQAGLFGGGIAVLLGFIALLPYIGLCISLPLYPLAFFFTGMAVVRVADQQAGVSQASAAGAAAGAIAGIVGGLAALFLAPLRLAVAGGAEELVASLPPDVVQSLVEAGLDPVAVMELLGGVGAGALCCSAQLVSGALLAAAGAALYAAYRRT